MICNKRYINHLRHDCRMKIDNTLERYILSEFEEPFPFGWSEQGLFENIRKLEAAFNNGSLIIPPIPSRYKRLQKRYYDLQQDIVDLATLYFNRCGELPEQFEYLSMVVGVKNIREVAEHEF